MFPPLIKKRPCILGLMKMKLQILYIRWKHAEAVIQEVLGKIPNILTEQKYYKRKKEKTDFR